MNERVTCGGCPRLVPQEELVWIANGWDFWGCTECVAACAAVEAAERKPAQTEILKSETTERKRA